MAVVLSTITTQWSNNMALQIKPWYLDLIVNEQPALPSPKYMDKLLAFKNDNPEISNYVWLEFVELRKTLITTMQNPYVVSKKNDEYHVTLDVVVKPVDDVLELINIWAKELAWKSVSFVTINSYSHYSGFNIKHGYTIDVIFSTKES